MGGAATRLVAGDTAGWLCGVAAGWGLAVGPAGWGSWQQPCGCEQWSSYKDREMRCGVLAVV